MTSSPSLRASARRHPGCGGASPHQLLPSAADGTSSSRRQPVNDAEPPVAPLLSARPVSQAVGPAAAVGRTAATSRPEWGTLSAVTGRSGGDRGPACTSTVEAAAPAAEITAVKRRGHLESTRPFAGREVPPWSTAPAASAMGLTSAGGAPTAGNLERHASVGSARSQLLHGPSRLHHVPSRGGVALLARREREAAVADVPELELPARSLVAPRVDLTARTRGRRPGARARASRPQGLVISRRRRACRRAPWASSVIRLFELRLIS
jgi:hypothetical protein